MWESTRRQSALLITFAALLSASGAVQGASPADWAPKDAMVVVEVPNFKTLREQFKKTLFYQLFEDPQVKKLMGEPLEDLKTKMDKAATDLGLGSADALKVWPEGGAAFIVTVDAPKDEGDEPTPHLGLAGEWGANHEKLQTLLEKAGKYVVDNGGKKDVATIQGIKVTTLKLKKKADDAGANGGLSGTDTFEEMREEITFATVDKVTLIGSDTRIIEQLIGRVKNQGESVTANEDYKALARHCAPLGQMHFFLNYPRLTKMMAAAEPDGAKMNKALGFDRMSSVVGTMDFATKKGAAVESRFFQPSKGTATGIMKLLSDHVTEAPIKGKLGLPKSTVVGMWMNMDVGKIIDEIYEIVKAVDPEEAESFKGNLKTPAADGSIVDLAEVFRSFAGPFKLYWSMNAPFKRENVSIVLSVGHKDREVVGKIFDIIGPMLLKRDLMGQSIYEVAMMPIGAALALTDGALAVGSVPGIEQLIRSNKDSGGEGLESSAQFRRAARLAPDKAWQMFYVDLITLHDAALALYKNKAAAGEPDEFSMDMTDGLLGGLREIPFDKLDNPDGLRKYMFSLLAVQAKHADGAMGYMNVMGPG
jgi:hypothetical protein